MDDRPIDINSIYQQLMTAMPDWHFQLLREKESSTLTIIGSSPKGGTGTIKVAQPRTKAHIDIIVRHVINTFNSVPQTYEEISLKDEAARQVESGVETLREDLDSVKALVANIQDQQANTELLTKMEAIEANFASITTATQTLSAPIILPSQEDMTQRLFSSQSLERLEESRSDEQWAILVFGIIVGGIAGIIVNVATADTETVVMTQAAWVLLGALVIALIVAAIWLWRIHQRVNSVRTRMFGRTLSHQQPNKE